MRYFGTIVSLSGKNTLKYYSLLYCLIQVSTVEIAKVTESHFKYCRDVEKKTIITILVMPTKRIQLILENLYMTKCK